MSDRYEENDSGQAERDWSFAVFAVAIGMVMVVVIVTLLVVS